VIFRWITVRYSVERVDRARVFWSGTSQVVRLPREYRFEGTEVRIRKRGAAVILEPIPSDWGWLDERAAAGLLDADFVEAVRERQELPTRPELDRFFR
jgi:antitoxin VapB